MESHRGLVEGGCPKAVEIEALVLRASQFQGLPDGAFAPGSMLANLSQSAQNEILKALSELHTTIALTSSQAEGGPAEGNPDLAQTALGNIQQSVSAICNAVETPSAR